MSAFIGEIKMFAGNFAPRGWYFCQGQELSVAANQALFSVIGTAYGGNGQTTFNLPDLRGRVPLGTGTGPGLTKRTEGQFGGVEMQSLTVNNLPPHNHIVNSQPTVNNKLSVVGSGTMKCSGNAGNSTDPTNAFLAKTRAVGGENVYTTDSAQATDNLNTAAIEITNTVQGSVDVSIQNTCLNTGAGTPVQNMQPWTCLNYIINWDGIYPERS